MEQNFNTEISGKQIDNCVEYCYGITKGIDSNLDRSQVISNQIK